MNLCMLYVKEGTSREDRGGTRPERGRAPGFALMFTPSQFLTSPVILYSKTRLFIYSMPKLAWQPRSSSAPASARQAARTAVSLPPWQRPAKCPKSQATVAVAALAIAAAGAAWQA